MTKGIRLSTIATQAAGNLRASADPFDSGARKVNDIIPMLEQLERDHENAIYHLRNLVTFMDETQGECVNFTLDAAKEFLRERGQL